MTQHRLPGLLAAGATGILLATSSPVHADCLPTLGITGCLRWDYFQIQPLEHHYLDVPTRGEPRQRIHKPKKPKATDKPDPTT